MKILYIATERRTAQLAAVELKGVAPNVSVMWAGDAASAAAWMEDNRDAAAIIVEATAQGQGSDGLVDQVRGLGLPTPILVVAPEQLGAVLGALRTHLAAALARERARSEILEARLAQTEARHTETQQRLTESEAQYDASLGRVGRICTELQERLLALEAAARASDERRAADATVVAELAARREAELSAALTEAVEGRVAADGRVAKAETALEEANERAASDRAAAAARRAELENRLAQEARARRTLEQQLATAAAALEHARQERATEATAAGVRVTELETRLAQDAQGRRTLEQQLAEAAAAIEQAKQERATEATAAGVRVAELETRLAQEAQGRRTLEQQLAEAAAAIEQAKQERAAEATAAAEHLAEHEAELAALAMRLAAVQGQYDAARAENAAARATFDRQLADRAAALEEAKQEQAAAAAAAADHLARREAELNAAVAEASAARTAAETDLADVIAARTSVEEALVRTEAALLLARQRAEATLAGAAERHAQLESQLVQEATARQGLDQQLAEARMALEQANQTRAAEAAAAAEHLAKREAELAALGMRVGAIQEQYDAAVAENAAARAAFDRRLADAAAALEQSKQEHAAVAAAAAARQAELENHVAREAAARSTLEQQLAEARTALEQASRKHVSEAAAAADHLARREAELGAALADAAAARTSVEAALADALAARTAVDARLAEAVAARTALEATLASTEAALLQARQRAEAELTAAAERESTLREHLDQEKAMRTTLEGVLAERDAEVSAQAARHLAAQRTSEEALARLEETLRLTLEAGARDIARLDGELTALRRELDATRARAEALRIEAGRLPGLQAQLEASRQENQRQFERAPFSLCETTRDGTITRANRSLARLLGYRNSDDLRGLDFAATVFECPGDLRWLIDRSVSTGKMEGVETTWKTRDRRRLSVRLHAATSNGAVALAVEDLTGLRAIEERLRQAQRMEAVGRLASEVAVTCDTLLRDVTQDGQQWLAAFDGDTPLRHQGELLLGEVTRAAGFLRQFAAYGHKQIDALEPVSVQRVLRDLAPVLKRVAGDDITLVLPKTSHRFEVDVDAERVERILVNVANYARARMPHGGQVKIELATTLVDRKFLASHPNVRPGAHVLITVTEVPGAIRPALPAGAPAPAAGTTGAASDRPGVDVGALLTLIGDSGGHLWLAAEPAGNMTLRIHLPRRVSDEGTEAAAPAGRSRGRQLARWFRH